MKRQAFFYVFLFSFLTPYFSAGQASNAVLKMPVSLTYSALNGNNDKAALLISGDGGWYHFEQLISNNLAQKGIPTIGLDSRKFLWQRKTPEETASDIAATLNFYGSEWDRHQFILIGYSLGAEIMPFIVNRLPENLKSKIFSIVLLSPEETTDFEIHVSNMLGVGNSSNTYKTIEEIIKMPVTNTLLIFGAGEKTKVPSLLSGKHVRIVKIPGDHHYKSNVPLIIQTMDENNTF